MDRWKCLFMQWLTGRNGSTGHGDTLCLGGGMYESWGVLICVESRHRIPDAQCCAVMSFAHQTLPFASSWPQLHQYRHNVDSHSSAEDMSTTRASVR